jgi:hypothetical protein
MASMMRRTLVLLTLLTVGLAPAAPVKKEPAGDPQGHLEMPNDRHLPTPPQTAASRERTEIIHNGHVSVQVNVDASGFNIVGDAANEPSIAVDPIDPTRIAIGWRQFDNIASDFRQAGVGYTDDAGYSWTFPGVIDPGVFRSDPVLDSDADGNFFYNSLTADDGPSNFRCRVYKSVDGGATWDSGVYAYGGDKQWQVIDTTAGIGRNNIYATWNSTFSSCSGNFTRSYDGGQSFLPCTTVAGDPYWGVLAVGPDGELYVSGTGMTIAKSTTMQDSSLPAAWDYSDTVDLDGSLEFSVGPNPGGLLGQNWVAVDRSDGPTRGNVYMLASVDRSSTPDPLDVMFARSEDGGISWSAAVRVNDDPGTTAWQWFGTMSVAPNGRIDAIWLDTRNDTGGGYLSQLYYSFSTDAGVTWSVNEELSPQFDPHVGWPQQSKMGDYFDMVSDDLGANLAYAATFNGEQDVYFIRIGDPACPDDGRLTLDRPKYACDGEVDLTVLDCGLDTDSDLVEQVVVAIDSDSETGIETVTLTETAAASARFVGSILLSEIDAAGVLLITEGDTVTATYIDADDGAGGIDVPVIEQAPVECTPPLIFNVQVTDVGPVSATVTFDSDEPTRGTVHYGPACGMLDGSASGSGFSTSPTVPLSNLNENSVYSFIVEAVDEAGNSATDDNGGECYTFVTPDIPNYFTEQFSNGIDLDGHKLTFTPNGSVDFYSACIEPITALPTDPAGGTAITLTDDDEQEIVLTGGETVSLYGVDYSSFWVVSNGYVTFTGGETGYDESYAAHFSVARVSALFDDLTSVSAGTISYQQLPDRAVATWQDVPEITGGANTFQIELFFDGTITISYLGISCSDAIAGLSDGSGLSSVFYPTDLSEAGTCGPRPPAAGNAEVTTPIGTPLSIELQAGDDGLPEVPGVLSYTIVSLPADGYLEDTGVASIASVPHTLVGNGNQVTYVPAPGQIGPDSFQFIANDGGVPPEGGDSNTATVTVIRGGPQPIHDFMLDSDPGWTTTGAWAFGEPTGGGSHDFDPTSGYSGTNVYGYNLAGDYASNMGEERLISSAIDLADATETRVEFRRWLGIESSTYDHAAFQVSASGIAWTTIWEHSGGAISESSWSLQSYDISAVADNKPTVYLRWVMGATDDSVTYPGWNIDDIRVWGALPSQSCSTAPGEASGLRVSGDRATLVWNRPADMGGPVSPLYDVLRSDSPQDFMGSGICVESDDGADTVASDADEPAPEAVFFYLVRAENDCGAGSLGVGAAGERLGIECVLSP